MIMRSLLQTFSTVRRHEIVPVLLAGLFFFCILTALMVVRPAREALGMQRGIEAVRWLFLGTLLVTLLVNPLFGYLVSRFRRRRFVTVTYLFFALGLGVFYALLAFAPAQVGVRSGQVFYVWFSVFNLFATMLFWAFMADSFTADQSERLFGAIAVGGTLGAIAGPALAGVLASWFGVASLLLAGALALVAALIVAGFFSTHAETESTAPSEAVIGGGAWEGLRLLLTSPYLLAVAGYVVMVAVIATFLYFTRLQMVAQLALDTDTRAAVFARIDLVTQVATLALQAVLTGHIMKRCGVGVAMVLLPLTVMLGFAGLALAGTLAALIAFESAFRAVQRGVMRPARETLFTVVPRAERYKAKAFIDTFVYRGGDALGAQTEGILVRLGFGLAGLAAFVLPLALVWGVLGVWLGYRRHQLKLKGGSNDDTT